MCTVLLPPGVNPIAINKYIIAHQRIEEKEEESAAEEEEEEEEGKSEEEEEEENQQKKEKRFVHKKIQVL